jgi:hypothetical protein
MSIYFIYILYIFFISAFPGAFYAGSFNSYGKKQRYFRIDFPA